MGRKSLKVKGYTPDEIKKFFNKEDKYTIGIRLYAIYQVSLGKSTRQLQTLYNTSFKQICNWVHRFEKYGVEGLKNKSKSGRRPRLSKEQKNEIINVLQHNRPDEFEYNTATWNGPILIDFIYKKYGIKYKKAQIYNILKSLGFSYQKGRVNYPEADPEKRKKFIETFKKTNEGT